MFYLLTCKRNRQSCAASNSFKSEMETPTLKAEKHRIILLGGNSEDHIVQHPAPSRTTAST